jgi:hypothetical protein
METIRGNVLPAGYVTGDPDSYRKDTNGLSGVDQGQTGTAGNNWLSAVPGGGSITQSIDISSSTSHGVTWGVDMNWTEKIAVGGAKMGLTQAVSYEGGYAWISTSGSSFSGTVANMPRAASAAYSFDWRFFYHTARLNGEDCLVLEYLTKNVSQQ